MKKMAAAILIFGIVLGLLLFYLGRDRRAAEKIAGNIVAAGMDSAGSAKRNMTRDAEKKAAGKSIAGGVKDEAKENAAERAAGEKNAGGNVAGRAAGEENARGNATEEAKGGGKRNATERVEEDRKKIALTFDDGPHPSFTEQLLDGLKERGVHATFFVTGEHASLHPDIIKRMWDDA